MILLGRFEKYQRPNDMMPNYLIFEFISNS